LGIFALITSCWDKHKQNKREKAIQEHEQELRNGQSSSGQKTGFSPFSKNDTYNAAVVAAQTDSKNQPETQKDSRIGQQSNSRELE